MKITRYKDLKSSDVLVIIPFKNESFRLHKLIQKIHSLRLYECADILLVDGGSTDDSINEKLFAEHHVHALLQVPMSKGLSEQLRGAFKWALQHQYKQVITIDANGKDDPVYIFEIIKKLESGYDFVQGSRYITGGLGVNTPWLRHFAIKCIHVPALRAASGFHWTDTTQGYRGYATKIFSDARLDIFREVFQRYELLAYLNFRLPRLDYKCTEIAVVRTYPVGPVPTQIKGFRAHFGLFLVLIKVCFGLYNPGKR